MAEEKCPFCETLAGFDILSEHHYIREYRCPFCGDFYMARQLARRLSNKEVPYDEQTRLRLPALAKERHLAGYPKALFYDAEEAPVFSIAPAVPIKELLSNWPDEVLERLDRALSNLAALSPEIGHQLKVMWTDKALLFAGTVHEAAGIASALMDDGFLDGAISSHSFTGKITTSGWRRIRELRSQSDPMLHPAFVAMWFTPEMNELYTGVIAPTVREAGYKVAKVDLVEHNEYIMDKVLGMIRVAPFVVAEYTGHRNGVYFEAGFARGLGIPVVSCCRQDQVEHEHFDIKQLNVIHWSTTEELKDRLLDRILGSIGAGPFKKDGE